MKPLKKQTSEDKQKESGEEQYPISSESECSCRVEGSGSQCNVLKQPNHQTVLVRERQDREKREENKRMNPYTEDKQKGELFET